MHHRTTVFSYDDLHRLISASTTAASSTSFSQTYTYSSIGNITNKSDLGAYSYSGTGSTNPHAVTSIGSSNLAYDTNGNLTSYGSSTYAWDYRNRLTTAYVPSATTTYAYDHTEMRVKKIVGASSTIYASDLYNTDGTTKTKHVYAGGDLIATITTVGSTSTKQYIHSDHLGGMNVVTDASGTPVEVTDYYPFGSQRYHAGDFTEQKKFIGRDYDTEDALSYLMARYYDGARGGFLSQDPVFLEDPKAQSLESPQSLNSYSYAGDNPITLRDPMGRDYLELSVSGAWFGAIGAAGIRIDTRGIDWFTSGGYGISTPVGGYGELAYSTGVLSHQTETTVSRTGKVADVIGLAISREGQYNPNDPLGGGNNQQNSYAVVVGAGASLSQDYTYSHRLKVWGAMPDAQEGPFSRRAMQQRVILQQNQKNNVQISSSNSTQFPSQSSHNSSASYQSQLNSLSRIISALQKYFSSSLSSPASNRSP